VGRVFLAIFFMAVSPVLSLENPLGVGLTATSNFNRDRDYASSPLDDLRDSAIPVFVAHGSRDNKAAVEGSDVLVMELLRNPARRVSYITMPDVDHDYVDLEGHAHHIDLMLVFLRWALDPQEAREAHIGLPKP